MTRLAKRGWILSVVLLSAFFPATGWTFPGSTRWGYSNCRGCHFNVAGGGILTPYGRQMSRELLSTWGNEKEAEFSFGRVTTPAWLTLGGGAGLMQTSGRGPGAHSLHLMNADLELAAHAGRWLVVAAGGPEPMPSQVTTAGWGSRRHFVQYDFSPTLSARAGRFLPNYGVWNGDLTVATRAGLGWDVNAASYNLEANHVGERFGAAVTLIGGRLDHPSRASERGASASASMFFTRNWRVGVGVLATDGAGQVRRAAGVHGVFGIGGHAYLLTETDVQRRRTGGSPAQWEAFSNWCLARETVKGLYVLLLQELVRRDLGHSGRVSHTYGAALRWFPRPHFEVQVRWRQQDREAASPSHLDGVSTFVRFYP